MIFSPAESEWEAIRIEFFDDQIESIRYFDPLTGEYLQKVPRVSIYPKTHAISTIISDDYLAITKDSSLSDAENQMLAAY